MGRKVKVRVPEWESKGSCAGQFDLFFPDPEDYTSIARAMRVCGRCPVIERCKEASASEEYGVWAGVFIDGKRRMSIDEVVARRPKHRPRTIDKVSKVSGGDPQARCHKSSSSIVGPNSTRYIKISPEKRSAILLDDRPTREIARAYGVAPKTIRNIRGHSPYISQRDKVTDLERIAIRCDTRPLSVVAEDYDLNRKTVWRIRKQQGERKMALTISTTGPDSMNQVPEGQVRINVSVDVPKAQKSAARNALLEAATDFEAADGS